jgi:outer membrane immunogenic protein
MKRLLLSTAIFFGLGATAFAADAISAMPPASFNWTGGYIGAQAGYAWGKSKGGDYARSSGALDVEGNIDPDGFLGGVYAGYNYQFNNNLVLCGEADLNYAHLTGEADPLHDTVGPVPPNSARGEMTWNGSARIRAGYAFDRFLPYVTGGVAFGRYKFTPDYINTGPLPGAKTQTGWTVGAGVDYAFTKNLIARVEYRYTDYGHANYDITGFPDYVSRVDLKTSAIQIGIAYKF